MGIGVAVADDDAVEWKLVKDVAAESGRGPLALDGRLPRDGVRAVMPSAVLLVAEALEAI